MRVTLNEQMLDVVDFFKDMGKVYFVGGCVRDLIMGVEPYDYDLTTAVIPSDIETYRTRFRQTELVLAYYNSNYNVVLASDILYNKKITYGDDE